MNPTSSVVACKYGAPMGRGSSHEIEPTRVHLQRVELCGDYDKGGAYWGCHSYGSVLYVAYNDNGFTDYVRAKDRNDAGRKFIAKHNGLTLLRGIK